MDLVKLLHAVDAEHLIGEMTEQQWDETWQALGTFASRIAAAERRIASGRKEFDQVVEQRLKALERTVGIPS